MRLLVLGGTWFLGRTIAEQALSRSWEVTCFNRGRTGRDVPGVTTIRGDRRVDDDLHRLAQAGPWDAIIDTSAYEPPDVLRTTHALHPVAPRYALVSTVSAYRHWPTGPVTDASPLWPSRSDATESAPDIAAMPVPRAYGTLKAGCEQAVREVYAEASLIVRPGVVLGPYEYVGRLPTLLRRAQRGGPILAAGHPDRPIQPIDVRDLSHFLLDSIDAAHIEASASTVFNATAPVGHATYGDLLEACINVTGAEAELIWVDSDWLQRQGVRQWTEIPLWRTSPGTWAVDSTVAQGAGLTCRPIQETVSDTWRWLQVEEPVQHERAGEHGLMPERERQLLAAWAVHTAQG